LALGFLSSLGLLVAKIRFDFIRTHVVTLDTLDPQRANAIIEELGRLARNAMAQEGVFEENYNLEHSADLRYRGQGYELTVGFSMASLDDSLKDRLATTFHAQHFQEYGFSRPTETIEVVNFRTSISERNSLMHWSDVIEMYRATVPVPSTPGPYTQRPVLFDNRQVTTAVWNRQSLHPGVEIKGPVIIEDTGATILALPGQLVNVDDYSNILIQVQ
jgi:N-methylhydantoinase A